jgi:hypothetical protein
MLSPHHALWTVVLFLAFAISTGHAQAETDPDAKEAARPSEADVAAIRARALETEDPEVLVECARALALIDGPEAAEAMADILVARVVSLGVCPATRVVAAACRMTLKQVTVTPAERRRLVLLCQLYHKAGTPLWVALQEVKDTEGVFWRDKILAAGALAARGDAEALEFLLKAYGETALLLPPVKQIQEEIREALCAVPDVKATTFLTTELQRVNDPVEYIRCINRMLQVDNAQAIVLVRRLFPMLKDDLDLFLAEILLRVLDRYGERRDLALLQAIGSEKLLAGLGPDRGRLEEIVQRTRAKLSAESAAPEAPKPEADNTSM